MREVRRDDTASLRTRKRFARRQWARRWLAWRPLLALVLVVALLVGTLWLVFFSSVLAVDTVEVDGTRDLDPATVQAAAGAIAGEPLARVDLDQVRSRVEALAYVRSADVTRQWPHTVLVTIEERVAIAVVEIGGQVRGMDRDGVVFRTYHRAPAGLPHVRTSSDTGSEALQEGADVVRALPEKLVAKVAYVSVATVDQIELVLRDGRFVLWGSAEESEQKAQVLEQLLGVKGTTYDVSVPSNATVSQRPPQTPTQTP